MLIPLADSSSSKIKSKNANYDELVKRVPLENLLLETDRPFLTPVPFRGKRNEPAHVVHVAETVAEVYGRPIEEVARITTENVVRLFGLPEGLWENAS